MLYRFFVRGGRVSSFIWMYVQISKHFLGGRWHDANKGMGSRREGQGVFLRGGDLRTFCGHVWDVCLPEKERSYIGEGPSETQ